MKITCVIPNFNDSRIARAISSFEAQVFQDKELVVVDSESTNQDVLKIYDKNAHVIDKLICEPDAGIFDALNKGVRNSSGDVIFLMGSDDYLPENDIFARVAERLDDDTQGVCIGVKFFRPDGKVTRVWLPRKVSSQKIQWGLLPPHFSLFLRKGLYEEVGEFDISIPISSDSEWLLRMSRVRHLRISIDRERFLMMEAGGVSNAGTQNIIRANADVARSWRRHGFINWWIVPAIKLASKVSQLRA